MSQDHGPDKGRPEACLEDGLAQHRTLSEIQLVFVNHVRKNGSLTPIGIKALLEAEGVTIRTFAELLGVTEGFVHQVISRHRRNKRVEDAITERLARYGFASDRIWGRQTEPAA
ncbi:MAG: hypothetical protein P4L11_13505 [Geothrix sp.]|nr:hypothetical protein [Geothrix sp.]